MSEQYPSKTEGEPSDVAPEPATDYGEQKPASDDAEEKPAADYVEPKPAPDYAEPKPAPDYVEPQRPPVEHRDDDEDEDEDEDKREKSEVTETIESRIEDVKQKARELLDDRR